MEKGTCKIEETCEEEERSTSSSLVVVPVNEPPAVALPLASMGVQMQAAPTTFAYVAETGTMLSSIPNFLYDKTYSQVLVGSCTGRPYSHGSQVWVSTGCYTNTKFGV